MANIVVTDDNTTIYVSDGDVVKIDIPDGGTVTIKADPNSSVDNFKIQFFGDDHTDIVKIDLATFSANDLQIDIQHYDPTDEVQLVGGFNMGVDPNNDDEYDFSYVGADGATYGGHLKAKDGLEDDFNTNPIVICFTQGTIIETEIGPMPVESIREGDRIRTKSNGLQPVRWIGMRRLDSIDLMRHPSLRPITFAPGSLGDHLPYRPLGLSPQHRVEISDWRAEYLFGEPNVLTAAKHLTNDDTITTDHITATVQYYHLLFDAHEIVFANGVPVESLHPGDVALGTVSTDAGAEIHQLFPCLDVELAQRKTAHTVLRAYEAQTICAYAS